MKVKHKKDITLEHNKRPLFGNYSKFHWAHWIIIIASLLLTIGVWQFSERQLEEKIKIKFEKQADYTVSVIKERMSQYEDALWAGIAALLSHDGKMNYQQWKDFSNTLKIDQRHQGINGIGIIHHLTKDTIEQYLQEQRLLRPNFNIIKKGIYDEFLPITFIEPIEKNSAAVGLDMTHEKNRYAAAIKARNTALPQITAPITLIQDKEKTPGFLFFLPFYKDNAPTSLLKRQETFLGLVYAPFIAKNLIVGALGQELDHISIEIYDEDIPFYKTNNTNNTNIVQKDIFKKEYLLNIYGRHWTVKIKANDQFYVSNQNNIPLIILMSAIIIDILIFSVFFLLITSNKRAIYLAEIINKKYKEKFNEAKSIKINLQKKDQFLNLILDTIPNFIFVKDNQFRIVEANNAFINNYPESERSQVIGYTTLEKYPPKEADDFLENDRIALKEGYHETEETITFPNGEKRTLITKKILFNDGEHDFILGISHDVTNMKKAEKEILRSNTELEKFAFLASHDLQEPLRMIKNFTEILQEDYKHIFDSDAHFHMNQIISASARMQELIKALLDHSKIQANEITLKDIDANISLSEALKNLRFTIEETKTKITFDNLPVVYSNNMQLIRIFQNLIQNAIKYRKDNIDPKIHISVIQNEKSFIFSIADNGIGIEEVYLKKIFVLFKRLHNNSAYSGTGIGLSICEKIIKSLGGNIWATSEVKKGSIFYFSIPKKERK